MMEDEKEAVAALLGMRPHGSSRFGTENCVAASSAENSSTGKSRAYKASSSAFKAIKVERKKPLKKRSKKASPRGVRKLPRVASGHDEKEPISQVLSNTEMNPGLKVTTTPLDSEALDTSGVQPGTGTPTMVGSIVVPPTSPAQIQSGSLNVPQQASSDPSEVAQLALLSAIQQANQPKKPKQQDQAPVLETGLLAWQVLHSNPAASIAPTQAAQVSAQEQELAALLNQFRSLQSSSKTTLSPVSSNVAGIVDPSLPGKLLQAEIHAQIIQAAAREANTSTDSILALLFQAQLRELQQQTSLATGLLQGSLQQQPTDAVQALLASIVAPQQNQAHERQQPDLNALASLPAFLQLALARQL